VHVCRRWRFLILQSASHLRLSLLCTQRTPVADMLAHSPPLPLVIDHVGESRNLTPEDEEGIKLALRHHDHVRRIRLAMFVSYLPSLVDFINKEFPILEHLYIDPVSYDDTVLYPRDVSSAKFAPSRPGEFCPSGGVFVTCNSDGSRHILPQRHSSICLLAHDRSAPQGVIDAPSTDTWDLVLRCCAQSCYREAGRKYAERGPCLTS